MLKYGNYFSDEVGQILPVFVPAASATDSKLASDNANGIPIQGMDAVTFLIALGSMAAAGTLTFQVQYSSTGLASDAVTSNASMSCTDAVVVITTASAYGGNTVYIIDVDLRSKGLSDAAGKLFCTKVSATEGAATYAVIGIPHPGTNRVPISQAKTVIKASA